MTNSIAWLYLPYIAFLGMVIAGLHYKNFWAFGLGLLAIYLYDVKPELEIICKRPIYNNCRFIVQETNDNDQNR